MEKRLSVEHKMEKKIFNGILDAFNSFGQRLQLFSSGAKWIPFRS